VTESNVIEPFIPHAPFNTVRPVMSGNAVVGQTLSVTEGEWIGDPVIVMTYQWWRHTIGSYSDHLIEGATDSDYAVTEEDVGFLLHSVIKGTNDRGRSYAYASPFLGPVTE